jgi:hypothetical protein
MLMIIYPKNITPLFSNLAVRIDARGVEATYTRVGIAKAKPIKIALNPNLES